MSSSILEKWDSLPSCNEQLPEPIFKTPSPFWNQDIIFKRPRQEYTPDAVREAYNLYTYRCDLGSRVSPDLRFGAAQTHSSLSLNSSNSRYLPPSSELLVTDPNMLHFGRGPSYWRYFTPEAGYGLVKGFRKLRNPQTDTLPASYFYRGVNRDVLRRDFPMEETQTGMQKHRLRYSHCYQEPQSQRVSSKRDCERYYVKTNPLLGSLLHADPSKELFKYNSEHSQHHLLGFSNDAGAEKKTSEGLPLLLWSGDAQKRSRNAHVKSSSSALWVLRRFVEGSLVELEGGRLKRVEDLRTEDLELCAQLHPELMLKRFTVLKIIPSHTPALSSLRVQIEHDYSQLSLEVSEGMPFFVYGHGWSSCNPQHTSQNCKLQCRQLAVGDLCLALTRMPASSSELANRSRNEVGEDPLILSSHAENKPTLQIKDPSRKRRFTAPELREISKIHHTTD
nr:uncharacterized protein LOC101886356 [Danio rerio]|eukprot:XP_017213765.1 uncharacterized protein LOC101886356 [Danio rerio]